MMKLRKNMLTTKVTKKHEGKTFFVFSLRDPLCSLWLKNRDVQQ